MNLILFSVFLEELFSFPFLFYCYSLFFYILISVSIILLLDLIAPMWFFSLLVYTVTHTLHVPHISISINSCAKFEHLRSGLIAWNLDSNVFKHGLKHRNWEPSFSRFHIRE